MANQDVRVSALQSASTLSTEDLALATVVDELSETGYTSKKITEGAKASQYMEAFTFANLNTSAKTIVGAINEAATTGGSDEFIIHMTDTTVTETAADIIDAFDNGSEIWLESQITGEALKARLPLLAYISDSNSLVLRFSGITYSNNRYRYCDVQMIRSPEQILGKQAINVTFAVIDDATTSSSSVWSSQKTASELTGKAEIDDTTTDTETTWSSSRIVSLLPTESASGAVASFETPLTLPLVSHNVTIEPVQSGTGDPSPSNVRPISGWSAVNVTRTGKNLFDKTDNSAIINAYLSSDGQVKADINAKLVYVRCSPNKTYTISKLAGQRFSACYSSILPSNNVQGYGEIVNNTGSTITITTGADARYIFAYVYHSSYDTDTFETILNSIQFEESATATAYEPYTGQTYTRTFLDSNDDPITVYGGELDVTSGVGTTAKNKALLSSVTNLTYDATRRRFSCSVARIKRTTQPRLTFIQCNIYKGLYEGEAYDDNWDNVIYQGGDYTYIHDRRFTTVTDLLNAWTNSDEFVYELETPVNDFHCDPTELSTLKGVNNIWADTGDTAVEYKQDIQTYIDSRLSSGTRSLSLANAPVETKEEETKQEEQEGDEDVDR